MNRLNKIQCFESVENILPGDMVIFPYIQMGEVQRITLTSVYFELISLSNLMLVQQLSLN